MLLLDLFLHLDTHLLEMAHSMGPWLYGLLFLVLFCETGLVVTPFLPGDSLLFAVGALSALPDSPLHIVGISFLLITAAFLGDNVNYQIGRWVGPRAFTKHKSIWFNPGHLIKTQAFFLRYGSFAVFLGRFAPIVRTFTPFVAGLGRMDYRLFCLNSFLGSVVWIHLFLYAGYFFGNLPFVKKNFHYVILAVILLSLVPILVGVLKRNTSDQMK